MYQYLGCGLDNTHLCNGYEVRRTASGKEVVWIDDVKGLHRAIARHLCDADRPLEANEFKFLRKEMEMSQGQAASMMGVEEQTVSVWERGGTINPAAENLLRMWMKEALGGARKSVAGCRIPLL
jgi:DNA-binding transcriptional regulator YiaG